jgi:hypothetical protein
VALRIVQLPAKEVAEPGTVAAAMRADCAARGDQCLDLAPLLPEDRIAELYFDEDPHWNPAGHRWAAEVIAS